MPEWIIYTFAYIGAITVVSGIICGITIAVVRTARWKNDTDTEIAKLFSKTNALEGRWDSAQTVYRALWQAVDDINKRLRDAEKEA